MADPYDALIRRATMAPAVPVQAAPAPAAPDLSSFTTEQLQAMLAARQAQDARQAPATPAGTDKWWEQYPAVDDAPVDPYAAFTPVSPASGKAPAVAHTLVPVDYDPFVAIPPAQPQKGGAGDWWSSNPVVKPGAPDLSHLSDDQLKAMLPAGGRDGRPAAGMFDDLIPQVAGQSAPLTVHGTPQSAGDALDMVEGTGPGAYRSADAPQGLFPGAGKTLSGINIDSIAAGIPFSDRMSAAAAAATGIGGTFGDYGGNLAAERAATERRAQDNPAGEMLGNLVGGGLLPVGAVGDVAKGATLGAKVLAGAKAGGAIGAAQGASTAPDLGDPTQTGLSTGAGAIGGAIIGGAAPAVGAGAGGLYRRLAGTGVQEAPGVPAAARDMVVRALKNDDPAQVLQKLRQYGPDATLSDLGPSLQGIAMGQAVKDGPGASIVLRNLAARHADTSGRILGDVASTTVASFQAVVGEPVPPPAELH